MKTEQCPECGGGRFNLVALVWARVDFFDNGDREVLDVYGDVVFDDSSRAVCVDCGWSGTLRDCDGVKPEED